MPDVQAKSLLQTPPATIPVDVFVDLAPVAASAPNNQRTPDCLRLLEPLVALDDGGSVSYLDAYLQLGILPARPARLRLSVVARLKQAAASLPAGWGLVVLDAWRSLNEQAALDRFYGSQAVADGFVAPVGPGQRPPHTTGGTVDLTLSWQNQPLALGTEFDDFSPLAATAAFEADGQDSQIRRLRRALVAAMTSAGFVNHQQGSEWWHWSFGDNAWANSNRCPALYDVADGGMPDQRLDQGQILTGRAIMADENS